MSGHVLELRAGARLWFEGLAWSVVEVAAHAVTLTTGREIRTVAVSYLSASAAPLTEEGQEAGDREQLAVVFGALTAREVADLEQRAGHIRELIAPLEDDPRHMTLRLKAKAAEVGVTTRTLQRWMAGYRAAGIAGLVDSRLVSKRSSAVDVRWDAACTEVLDDLTDASTPTRNVVLARVARRVEHRHGAGAVPIPSDSTAYRRLEALSKGRHSFGSGRGRRSVADRPTGAYGRLRATRPGEYVVLDTTPLDVFAMEPVTLRWVRVELTVAMDLFTRCVLGLRLTPVSTKSQDVANVLYQCVAAGSARAPSQDADPASWPFHGVPRNLLVGTEEPDGVSQERVGGLPVCMPEAIVVDHGRQYLSSHVIGACARLGMTIQPARPHTPTDKPTVERFFRTLRESFLQHLPAYKGPDVYSRGKDVESQAFLYVGELEQLIREWVGTVYHRTRHAGLRMPEIPGASFSPLEMFEVGIARCGALSVPTRPGLAYEFLHAHWRTIQHYGVEVRGQRYNGPGLNMYRNRRSSFGGVNAGKWPIMVDVHDVRYAYFQDPDTEAWHRLEWEHAPGLGAPFSQDAVDYAKSVSLRSSRHIDPDRAVAELLEQWSRGEVQARRDRSLARRLSAQRASDDVSGESDDAQAEARAVASMPGVIDLLERRDRRSARLEVTDDVVDVFERYYAGNPGSTGFESFDE